MERDDQLRIAAGQGEHQRDTGKRRLARMQIEGDPSAVARRWGYGGRGTRRRQADKEDKTERNVRERTAKKKKPTSTW